MMASGFRIYGICCQTLGVGCRVVGVEWLTLSYVLDVWFWVLDV